MISFTSKTLALLLYASSVLASSVVYWPPESLTPEGVASASLTVKPVKGTGADPSKITKTYYLPHNGTGDDAPALAAAINSGRYNKNSRIVFSKNVTYNMWSVSVPILFFPLSLLVFMARHPCL